MESLQIQSEWNALFAVASDAASGRVSAHNRKQFTVSLNYLTATLRALRTGAKSMTNEALCDFLAHTIHCALSVFNSTLHTYDLNRELCQQIIVFLGLVYAIPSPTGLPGHTLAGLRNVLDAIPHCFFVLASHGRKEDVRPLLNATFLVAGGPANRQDRSSWFLRLSSFRWWKASSPGDDDSHFIQTLKGLFTGWTCAGKALDHWTPVPFLDIAEAVTISVTMRLDRAHDSERRDLASSIFKVLQTVCSATKDMPSSLIPLTLCSGILKAMRSFHLDSESSSGVDLPSVIQRCITRREKEIAGITKHTAFTQYAKSDSNTLSAAFLLFRISPMLREKLTPEQGHMLRLAIESLITCGANGNRPPNALFHRQLQWCVNSYSGMLGSAYATLLPQLEEDYLYFLQCLCSENDSHGVAIRFALAVAVHTRHTADSSLCLIDALSFLRTEANTLFQTSSKNLVPILCTDAHAIRTLINLVITQLDTITTPNARNRVFFLLHAISVAVKILRESHPNNVYAHKDDDASSETDMELWTTLCNLLPASLSKHASDERYASGCIESMRQILQTDMPIFSTARTNLAIHFPTLLIRTYLLPSPTPSSQNRRLLHIASLLDAIATATLPTDVIQKTLSNLAMIPLSESNKSESQERAILVLLLRFMTRCNLSHLPPTMQTLSTFLTPSRKPRSLPLVRLAILNTDLLRKNTCLLWLLHHYQAKL